MNILGNTVCHKYTQRIKRKRKHNEDRRKRVKGGISGHKKEIWNKKITGWD